MFREARPLYNAEMTLLAAALTDPAVRSIYLGFCLALMVLPLLALWFLTRKRVKAGTVDKPLFIRVALLTLLWLVANAIALGFLMWADTVNGVNG